MEHLSEPITLDMLAAEACFSPYHFHRIFTALTGDTPRDYIERVKLEQAAKQLCAYPNKTISEVAEVCGFSSVSTFSRSFKKYHRVTPSELIRQHRHHYVEMDQPLHLAFPSLREADFSSVTVTVLPSYHVAYVQTLEGYRVGAPKAWRKLLMFAHSHELLDEDIVFLGIPYNNPSVTPESKCRYRACITVPANVALTQGQVQTTDIDGGKYAMYSFKGNAEDVPSAYAFLYGCWLAQSGYVPDDKPLLELYPRELCENCEVEHREYTIALPIRPI